MSPSSKGGQLLVEAVVVAVEGRSGADRRAARGHNQASVLPASRAFSPKKNQCTAKQETIFENTWYPHLNAGVRLDQGSCP